MQYAHHMHSLRDLGDPDSRFKEVGGITVHYKQCAPGASSAVNCAVGQVASDVAVALYHGFGANLWMWRKVQQQISDALGSKVLCHDMPGFGLTERKQDLKCYTLKTNGDLGRRLCKTEAGECSANREDTPVVLVGHSLGGAGVARSFAENPEGVAGIVLVAPAIMVSPFTVATELRDRTVMCAPASPMPHAAHACACMRSTQALPADTEGHRGSCERRLPHYFGVPALHAGRGCAGHMRASPAPCGEWRQSACIACMQALEQRVPPDPAHCRAARMRPKAATA
jgi:pimeloyl-ACP methyl ester carboxylesterase